jgi:hypothetical protein
MAASFTALSGANSFQGLISLAKRRPPSYSNLYWVRFRAMPKIFNSADSFARPFFNDGASSGPGTDESRLLTYYASDVTIPSRQLTTGEVKTVGNMYRYVTGTTFSEISMQFILSRDLATRKLFERWMNYTANDASQNVKYYNDYVCPFVDIFKYERGGVGVFTTNTESSSIISPTASSVAKKSALEFNKCSGVWTLSNVYPFNISNINLNAGPAGIINMEVSFYYERYRFFTPTNPGFEDIYSTLGPDSSAAASVGLSATTPSGTNGINPAATSTVLVSDGSGKLIPASGTGTPRSVAGAATPAGFPITGKPLTPSPPRSSKDSTK